MADYSTNSAAWNSGVDLTVDAGAASGTIPFSGADEKYIIIVDNGSDDTNALTATISSGDFLNEGVGDLEYEIGTEEVAVIGPLEGSRFKDSDADVTLALTGDGTITNAKVTVIKLP